MPRRRATKVDALSNLLTGLGSELRDASTFTSVVQDRPLDQGKIDILYASDPLLARTVDAIPEHAVRRWISVGADSEDAPDDWGREVLDGLEELQAQAKLQELMRLDRKDGGALLLLGADDGGMLEDELDIDSVESFDHMHVLERWNVRPGAIGSEGERQTDYTKPDFGEPLFYEIQPTPQNASAPAQKVHRSRVIALHGIKVSEQWMQLNGGWGQSAMQRAEKPVQRFRELLGYLGAALKNLSQPVYKMKGSRKLIAEDPGTLARVLAGQMMLRGMIKAMVIGEDDTFEEVGMALAGLEPLVAVIVDDLASATEQPLSVLFGHAPHGFSSDDEPGKRNFYDSIALKQRRLLLDPLNRIIRIMMAAKGGKFAGLPKVERWQVTFLPLEEPTDAEAATTRKTEAETAALLVGGGIIDVMEARSKYENDPNCVYHLESYETPMPQDPDAQLPVEGEPALAPGQPQPALSPGAPTDAPAGGAAPSAVAEVQKTAFTGVQTAEMRATIISAASKEISRESAQAILEVCYQLSAEEAARLLGPETFEAVKPPKPAFGGFGGPPLPPPPPKPDEPPKPPA